MKPARTALASMSALLLLTVASSPAHGEESSNALESSGTAPASSDETGSMSPSEQFSRYLADLLEAEPNAIVDHAWESDHGLIVVLPEHQDRLAAAVQDASVDIEVTSSDSGVTIFADRSEIENEVLDLIDTTSLEAAMATYDYSDDSVVVSVWGGEAAENMGELSEGSDAYTFNDGSVRDVEIVYRDDDAPVLESFSGGGEYASCTGGFTGWHGSEVGIFTAAHCSTASSYEGFTVENRYNASSDLDLQFSSLDTSTVFNSIFVGTSTTRSITGVGALSSGIAIENYGQATGYGETTVSDPEGCLELNGNTWCELWRTSDYITSGGDSGGPWFSGNTALATHTGGGSAGSLITPVQGLNSSFGSDAGISISSE